MNKNSLNDTRKSKKNENEERSIFDKYSTCDSNNNNNTHGRY